MDYAARLEVLQSAGAKVLRMRDWAGSNAFDKLAALAGGGVTDANSRLDFGY
jgi:hypothetical protein